MTTYNTGNGIGSADPRDLYDNAQNLDELVNSDSKQSHPDRLGVSRKTWHGMEREYEAAQSSRDDQFQSAQSTHEAVFSDFLQASGYQDIGEYAPGIEITAHNQYVTFGGQPYLLKPSIPVPYTTSGEWTGDDFKLIGDNSLRQDLVQPVATFNNVAEMVASGGLGVGRKVRTLGYHTPGDGGGNDYEIVAAGTGVDDGGRFIDLGNGLQARGLFADGAGPLEFGARGDGSVDSSAAFDSLESERKGQVIDLAGKTYAVQPRPDVNVYVNGTFYEGGFSRAASIAVNPVTASPKYSTIGGQIAQLRSDLTDPLVQFTGIVMIGDSNTWGSGTGESAPGSPRNQSLLDPRDFFGTATWPNNLKRYIGGQFFDGADPVISNWPDSPSGEAVATYTKEVLLFPEGSRFQYDIAPLASVLTRERAGSVSGWQIYPRVANNSSAYVDISFQFTGSEFTIIYTGTWDGALYDVLVNGEMHGSYSTVAPETTYNMENTVSFDHVNDAEITIKVRPPLDGESGVTIMYMEAIRINKTCRITNNGVIGVDSRAFRMFSLVNRKAVLPDDVYTFVQFGGNDRIVKLGARPLGVLPFEKSLGELLDELPETTNPILMSSNPGVQREPEVHSFTRQEARNSVHQVALARNIDFIDNFAAFAGLHYDAYTSDGTHMNILGHAIATRNILGAIEQA